MLRGTVNVLIQLDEVSGEPDYDLNVAAIRHYRDTLAGLGKELGLADDVPLSALVTLPGVVTRAKAIEDVPEELWKAVRKTLRTAIGEVVSAREREGAALWDDLAARCRASVEILERVEKRIPNMVEAYRLRLSERLAKLLEGVGSSLTEEDMRREIAMFAERSDISEEICRMRSHLEMLGSLETHEGPCGRRLEFIAQEMFREANTMASKANDAEMVREVLDLKAEIEKVREQALNVE